MTTNAQIGPLIRSLRKRMGLTLQGLSDRAGVSVGHLSQIERGNSAPTLATLAQIAQAFDVGLEYFVTTPKPSDCLTRADERPRFSLSDDGVKYETLGAVFPGAELSSYILHCPPGFTSEVAQHEGEEFLYILEGEIEQTLGDEVMTLRAGDSMHFQGSTPHLWRNITSAPARILWLGTLTVLQSAGLAPMVELKIVHNTQ